MDEKKARPKKKLPFANLVFKEKQVKKLSKLIQIDEEELRGKNLASIAEEYKHTIDPMLITHVRVCGQVVKYDPTTGDELPVPFATVHVEDTDCHLIALYPFDSIWGWFYPFYCTREEITSVVTDACGRFCVWIPFFDIDWILKWRLKWICYPEIFNRPSIKDLLFKIIHELPPIIYKPPKPFPPWPDPPILMRYRDSIIRKANEFRLPEAGATLDSIVDKISTFGNKIEDLDLDRPAFREEMPPPLSHNLLEKMMRHIEASEQLREHENIANPHLDIERFIGPFLRCTGVLVPEIVTITDVPDITFRVTQDVDGDGTPETIYSEKFFQVRWDSLPSSGIKLYASEIALTGFDCDTPVIQSGDPAILYAGLMPLFNPAIPEDAYHDGSSGYARRPNRPRSGGLFSSSSSGLAETPFMGTLQLYGRNQAPNAKFYRVLYKVNGSSEVPFEFTWPLYRNVGGVLQKKNVAPDNNGWYPIIPLTENWHPPNLLMNWPTKTAGLYELRLQLGDNSKTSKLLTNPINIRVDTTKPSGQFTSLKWREVTGSWPSDSLSLICPVIKRPAGKDIEIKVAFTSSAKHLRSTRLTVSGCGAGSMTLTSPQDSAEHWHTTPTDNAFNNAATFLLSSTAPPGAYTFHLHVISRAFNPAGQDGYTQDWNYDPVHIWRWYNLPISIVDD